jgi:demethylmenaquinone methyltransferase/2-methoxy-6-polyprenyl-1,4-benzoquinol methylase
VIRQSQSHAERVYEWWSGHPRLFDLFARAAFAGRYSELRREAADRIGLSRTDRVLDLACGTGPNFGHLVRRVPAGRVVGVDYARGMCEAAARRARRRGYANVRVARADAGHLPLPDDSVDGALCTLSLSAIPDCRAALAAVHRVVRPGGRFVVFDAQPYQEGPGRLLNPLVDRVSAWATNWYPDRDVPALLRETFGTVDVTTYNSGSAFLATATVDGCVSRTRAAPG